MTVFIIVVKDEIVRGWHTYHLDETYAIETRNVVSSTILVRGKVS